MSDQENAPTVNLTGKFQMEIVGVAVEFPCPANHNELLAACGGDESVVVDTCATYVAYHRQAKAARNAIIAHVKANADALGVREPVDGEKDADYLKYLTSNLPDHETVFRNCAKQVEFTIGRTRRSIPKKALDIAEKVLSTEGALEQTKDALSAAGFDTWGDDERPSVEALAILIDAKLKADAAAAAKGFGV